MQSKTIEVYDINELDDSAREYAYGEWLNHFYYPWDEENKATLDAFAELFPVKIKDWSYGGRGEGVSFEMTCDDAVSELSGLRLSRYIWNHYDDQLFKPKYYGTLIPHSVDKEHPVGLEHKKRYSNVQREASCVLTGYGVDEDILAPIYAFLKKPDNRTFKDLMSECFDSWVHACSVDMEYQASMEAFMESAEANEYQFTKDGRIA